MKAQAGFMVAVFIAASAGVCRAEDIVLTRTAQSGVASLLGYERSWDKSCQARGSQVTIRVQPVHGTVSVVPSESVIPATTPRGGSTGGCAGQTIAGNRMMYQSEPGFRGTDHVSWSVVYGNGSSGGRTDVTIDVR